MAIDNTKFGDTARWILKTEEGIRFQKWFLKNHWKQWLGGKVGQIFAEFVARKTLTNDRHNHVPVVIEISSDGGIRVYGYGANVRIINLVRSWSIESEILAEEYAELQLRGKQREVYGDARMCLAIGTSHCPTVRELVESIQTINVLQASEELRTKRD